ncbi:MAG: dTMP kinase [Deltaproteobacteria bacterium]|nr:dTMP kinase [Deltaproteobacteria bacterium]
MFITFEGIEGCGKTTQIRLLGKRLNHHSIPHIITLEPGGTRIGKRIRDVLLDSGNKDICTLAELLLYEADRAQHVEEVINPALKLGKWVICDRFFDATTVYQGAARGHEMEFIRILNEKVTKGVRPHMTFLLDCPVEIGLKRAIDRNAGQEVGRMDRFERERIDFHLRVREGYLRLAEAEKRRFFIIDASRSVQEVESMILSALQPNIMKEKPRTE